MADDLGKRFRDFIANLKSFKDVLDWFGLWPLVVALLSSAGFAIWSFLSGLPLPLLIVISSVALIVPPLVVLLAKSARLISGGRVYRKPDLRAWRHVELLRLYEAACLQAGIEPQLPTPKPACGWLQVFISAAHSGHIESAEQPLAELVGTGTRFFAPDLREYVVGLGEKWFAD